MIKKLLPCVHCLLIGAILFGLSPAQAQQVWPGDVNNNGIVNGVDLLWLGLAFGTEGPDRDAASTLWQAQPITELWPQSFPNGLNYAYADCDGDGDVEDDDLDSAILPNFRLTHGVLQPDGYANAQPGSAPKLSLVPSTTNANPGQTISIDVFLGSESEPIEAFYGVTFAGSYNPEMVQGNGTAFVFDEDESWMAPEPDDPPIEDLFFRDAPGGEFEVAFVRTNQTSIANGHGLIGTFSIIIEDIIVGLSDTLIIQIDSIMLIDQFNEVYSIVPDTVLIVVGEVKPNNTQEALERAVQTYPNPVPRAEDSWVNTLPGMRPLDIVDALGRTVPVTFTPYSDRRWRIQWPTHIAPGWYALRGVHEDGSTFARSILVGL
jgi:hypothetical protein